MNKYQKKKNEEKEFGGDFGLIMVNLKLKVAKYKYLKFNSFMLELIIDLFIY